jgi:hypothetical protein
VRKVMYTILHLDMGGWITTVREEGDQPRPLAVSGRPESDAAPDMVGMIYEDMRARERHRREGSLIKRIRSESASPSLCREFAVEHLHAIGKGEAVTFEEDFIRSWFGQHQAGRAKGASRPRNRRHSSHLTKVQPN